NVVDRLSVTERRIKNGRSREVLRESSGAEIVKRRVAVRRAERRSVTKTECRRHRAVSRIGVVNSAQSTDDCFSVGLIGQAQSRSEPFLPTILEIYTDAAGARPNECKCPRPATRAGIREIRLEAGNLVLHLGK